MLRRQHSYAPTQPIEATAGLPMNKEYIPANSYKKIGSSTSSFGNSVDCTDPFARMNPNQIPVPGTSIWTNPNGGLSKMGNAYDMMGLIASFDQKQRNTINPLELYACQNEGPSVLAREVVPLYNGCRRLILNGKMDIGYFQHENRIICNFGRLFLDKEVYTFPYRFLGYPKNLISVFLVKYRTPNILLQFEPIKEFNDELFGIGQLCKSSAVVMNYFWIAWAYMPNAGQQIFDFKV
ncbi:MAG: hypothetical protein SPF22_07455 [Candidatus Onthovivens sp.]|nr:hypothetical protein [Candidatus Onthovivens sp.]